MKFHWGHGIFIFITIFIVLAVAFIIFALNQSQDLVSDDYYDQGASYTKQMEINKRSSTYADSINISATDSIVSIRLCRSLASLADTLHVYFYKPSDKKGDLKLQFIMKENINISSNKFKNGRYVLKILWKNRGEVYNIEKEISIQ